MDQLDPNIPGLIEGDVISAVVIEGAPFTVQNLVIDPRASFDVQVEWKLFGALVPLWLAALDPAFDVSVYAESVGAGPEILIGTVSKDKNDFTPCGGVNCRQYSATVTVAPGTLPEDAGDQSGIYKLVVSVFLNSNLGEPGFDITGFREGPFIRVENPV